MHSYILLWQGSFRCNVLAWSWVAFYILYASIDCFLLCVINILSVCLWLSGEALATDNSMLHHIILSLFLHCCPCLLELYHFFLHYPSRIFCFFFQSSVIHHLLSVYRDAIIYEKLRTFHIVLLFYLQSFEVIVVAAAVVTSHLAHNFGDDVRSQSLKSCKTQTNIKTTKVQQKSLCNRFQNYWLMIN